MKRISLGGILIAAICTAFPFGAEAMGSVANAMCNPWFPQCPCNQVPGPNGQCVGGKNTANCPPGVCKDVTAGKTTIGICSAQNFCQGTGTDGPNGFGLDQVAKILGDLMGKLMQQGGGSQPPSTPPTSGTGGDPYANQAPSCSISASNTSSTDESTTATLTWTTTGTVTSASIAPEIGAVNAFGSQSVTVSGTTAYTMTINGPGGTNYCSTTVIGSGDTSGGDPCTGPFAALYSQCEDESDTSTPTTTPTSTPSTSTATPTGNIIASPNSGTSPLTVVFSTYENGNAGDATIDFGDGAKESANLCQTSGGACVSAGTNTHTYTAAGTYTARLLRHTASAAANCTSGCIQIGSVSVVVSQGATTTPAIFGNPAYLIPGLHGDIQIFSSGGTIIAGSRNQTGNIEVAGFYGSNTFNGQPQGVVAGICRARPWANSILSYVLPANFFDSLCVARGYQVGNPPPTQQPTVTITQTTSQTTTPKPTTSATTTTTSTVPAKVRVWSVPTSVPLGSRASIFWTSQGVTSCLVTSPDGSFSQTTLSGGASTVALTGATTFTISCLTPDGTPVTDYVTVNIAL